MQGIKASAAIAVIALVAATLVDNCKATPRFQHTENAPAVNDNKDRKEAEVIVSCFSGCKSSDAQCFIQCVQKDFPGKNPIEIFDSLTTHIVAAEVIFCTVGCGVSEVCEDIKAIEERAVSECVQGCAQFCMEDYKVMDKVLDQIKGAAN